MQLDSGFGPASRFKAAPRAHSYAQPKFHICVSVNCNAKLFGARNITSFGVEELQQRNGTDFLSLPFWLAHHRLWLSNNFRMAVATRHWGSGRSSFSSIFPEVGFGIKVLDGI